MSTYDPSLIDRFIAIGCGDAEPDPDDAENRSTRRCEHDATVALVQMTPHGQKSIPTIVQCKNISAGGMCLISKYMLHVGHEGVVLMQRSTGEQTLIGAKVVHCTYTGSMNHESGVTFIPLPSQFSMDDFLDDNGNMLRLESRDAA